MNNARGSARQPHSYGVEVVLVFLLVLALGCYLTSAIFAPSLYRHLVLGRWIRAGHHVPLTDLWTMAGFGQWWTTPSWLFDWTVAAVEEHWGFRGLIILKASVISLYVLTLCFVYSSRSGERFFGMLIAFFAACGSLVISPLEPIMFGWIILLLLIELIYRSEEGLPPTRSLPLIFTVVLAGINLHLSTLAAVFCGLLLVTFRKGPHGRLVSVVFYLLAVVPALFLTPYFGRDLLPRISDYFAILGRDLILRRDPADIYDYSFSFFIVFWVLTAFLGKRFAEYMRGGEILLVGVASVLGLAAKSHMSFALMLLGWFICVGWGRARKEDMTGVGEGIRRLQDHLAIYGPSGVTFLAVVIVIISIAPLVERPILSSGLPRGEMDYILKMDLPFPLFHERHIGSYVVYRLADRHGAPRKLAAIDERVDEISPELALAADRLADLKPGWRSLFEAISPRTILCESSGALFEVMMSDPGWKLVFFGGAKAKSGTPPGLRLPGVWAVFVAAEVEAGRADGIDSSSPQSEDY